MNALFAFGRTLFGRLNLCALSGALSGAATGFFFGLLQFHLEAEGLPLSGSEIVVVALLLGLLGWVTVLVVVGVWLRYKMQAIALPALINAVLTSVLTVYVSNVIQLPALASLVGLLIGILVGAIFCWLCAVLEIRWWRGRHG